MTSRKIFLYVFGFLIAVAVLVAVGFAIYRLGFAHGTQGSTPLTFERRFVPDFDRRSLPETWGWKGHGGTPMIRRLPQGFSWGFPGLLFGFGSLVIVALAIYGGISLLRPNRRDEGRPTEAQPQQTVSPEEDQPSPK